MNAVSATYHLNCRSSILHNIMFFRHRSNICNTKSSDTFIVLTTKYHQLSNYIKSILEHNNMLERSLKNFRLKFCFKKDQEKLYYKVPKINQKS